ncbi:MAG: pantoate--beta-alanine ligase [Planctomycetota bacterium]|nr:pantoate--beta-alanine ligase [Planctomycetota bacterium]
MPVPAEVRELSIYEDVTEIRHAIAAARRDGKRIGVVPTMGALHAGHLSLIEAARAECEFVVVTIFVNPTQFGPQEDLSRYPRPIAADVDECRRLGVDAVFHPQAETIYPSDFKTFVNVEDLSNKWEGAFRPGHFRGVATVVLKLFTIVQPDVAYFGQKDFQQQLIIKRMCRDLNVPVELRVCPIVRDTDGLALSSRNVYLSPSERNSSLVLSRSLLFGEKELHAPEANITAIVKVMREMVGSEKGVTLEYLIIADPNTLEEITEPQRQMVLLVAARVGTTRLIDNVLVLLPHLAEHSRIE